MLFMNRFLDLVEAIENDDGMIDPEGFEDTEIPLEGEEYILWQCFVNLLSFFTFYNKGGIL